MEPKISNLHKRNLDKFAIALIGKCATEDNHTDSQLVGEIIVLFRQLITIGQLDAAFMLIGAFSASDAI